MYESIRTADPLPTVASPSANSCSSSGVPEITSGRTRTRVCRSGMPEFAQRKTPTHILIIKCQASFFFGRLTSFLGHLGHEYQQYKFSYSNWASLTLWESSKIWKQQRWSKVHRLNVHRRNVPFRALVPPCIPGLEIKYRDTITASHGIEYRYATNSLKISMRYSC